ncbi:uncharacterized protein LOC125500199 [Athalia rosae]|uniref:uncharacterized protein LOC125500199 n=1 Tax=Athalia rosae TaxID=37344 RepID=UPI002033D25A|nr:uncharacterized protein LOC125500199 [Athalia rosae]
MTMVILGLPDKTEVILTRLKEGLKSVLLVLGLNAKSRDWLRGAGPMAHYGLRRVTFRETRPSTREGQGVPAPTGQATSVARDPGGEATSTAKVSSEGGKDLKSSWTQVLRTGHTSRGVPPYKKVEGGSSRPRGRPPRACKRGRAGLADVAAGREYIRMAGSPMTAGWINFAQNNLQHCKAASAVHSRDLARTMGIQGACNRDLVAVLVRQKFARGGTTDMTVASAYLPYDSKDPPPTEKLKALVRRAVALLEYLTLERLEILNRGSKPTFINSLRWEVIDPTLCTNGDAAWKPKVMYRNPRATDWTSYREELAKVLRGFCCKLRAISMVEGAEGTLKTAINQAHEAACPTRQRKCSKTVTWWNKELGQIRTRSQKLLNRALKTGADSDWKATQKTYKKKIKKSKKDGWRDFCSETEDLSLIVRLRKVFTSGPLIKLDGLALPDGRTAENQTKILTHMLETHFPGSLPAGGELPIRASSTRAGRGTMDWKTAAEIVTPDRAKWAIDTVDKFESPGADGIFPALLQEGGKDPAIRLSIIFRSCLAMRCVPMAWRDVKVVFIPKPGKGHYDVAKSWRPISLTFFLLETLERLVDRYIRDGALVERPIAHTQHAYQPGKSTKTALYSLIRELEGPLSRKGAAALCVFMDVEGAFDNTSSNAICEAASRFRINSMVVEWIRNMLQTRTVTASLGGTEVRAQVDRSCLQGRVLSPLLWTLVVDRLLTGLSEIGVTAVGYADDIAPVVTGDHPQRMTNRMQKALDLVQDWRTSQSLRINPGKTEMVLFTRKRRFDLGPIRIFGAELTRFTEAQKATATLWACKRMLGQTWGLRPRTVKWIQTAISPPQITYAAVIWWPATGRANNRKALERVYRLATLRITGAMRTTPTLAMGALFNLTPPHIAVETEAWRAALRLRFSGLWRGSGRGHTSILQPIKELIKEDISWEKDKFALLHPKGLVWFTDGSKKRGGAETGIWSKGPRQSMSLALRNTATVFQAKVFAILPCVREILTLEYRGKHIFICSDSRAALRSIDACVVRSKLVQECTALLRQLAQTNRVKLLWVPAHEVIKGNIEADRLAKKGASRHGPDRGCQIEVPTKHIKKLAKRIARDKPAELWGNAPGMLHTRGLLKGPSSGLTEELIELSRTELRSVTGLITGHWYTGKHLVHLELREEASCPRCGEEAEAPQHLLAWCGV